MQCTNLGGMEQSAYTLMKDLHGQGYDFTVVAMHPLGPGKKILDELGVPSIGCPYLGKFGIFSHYIYRREVRRHHPDLMLVTGPSVGNCWAASAFKKIPKILSVHFHHGTSLRDKFLWRGFYHLFSRFFDTVIFNSEFLMQEAISIFPPLKFKSMACPLSIRIPSSRSKEEQIEAKRELGLPEDSHVIGNAGWLIPRKRFDVLLRVAAALTRSHPNLWTIIAGSGELDDALRAMAAELGIGHRVRWLGWQNDLNLFYRALDVLIFNSDADAVGMTPLEAMAYGIPVVASVSYGGGLAETLRHKENGFLLHEHNIDALAFFCSVLLCDQKFAIHLGQAARDSIIERHHPSRINGVYKALFDDLVVRYAQRRN
jgi:L-malate glycosyltransferase